MPRPRQRRGRDAKKEEQRMVREQREKEEQRKLELADRERNKKSQMPWQELNHTPAQAYDQNGHTTVEQDDPNALPLVDPDTKAYFQQVAQQIKELEQLGVGHNYQEQDQLNQEEDDRPLLLRSALQNLAGNEIELAGDGETSVVLEQLLHSMDDFAKRVLADRFTGNYARLGQHRSASHVLQTLLTLAGDTVERESRGIVAPPPASASSEEASALPTMTALVLSIAKELMPDLPTLLFDQFGSHTLRVLLLLLAGKRPTAEGQRGGAERSKKSLRFRSNQGPMKSFLLDDSNNNCDRIDKGKQREDDGVQDANKSGRRVPPEFKQALRDAFKALDAVDADGIHPGDGVRKATMDDVAGPAVKIMLELEADRLGGWKTGGWADRVMYGLVEETEDASTKTEQRTEARDEFLSGLLRHPAGGPTFETLLVKGSKPLLDELWKAMFGGKLHRLAGNAVANFVVAVAVTRLDAEQFENAVVELAAISRERRGEWIDNSRTGVLRALLDRAAELQVAEGQVSEMIVDTFGLEDEKRNLLVHCVLSLNRYEHFRKLPEHLRTQYTIQGSVLLQSWLKLHAPHQQPVLDSVQALSFDNLLPLTRDPTASRVIDAMLSSPTTPPRAIRTFLLSLKGHYHTLADDRIGSRVAERCWQTADVYLKDKIAESLVGDAFALQASQFGHFFVRKVELPLWQRRRGEWKQKMAVIDAQVKGLQLPGQPAPAQAQPQLEEQAEPVKTNGEADASTDKKDKQDKKKHKRDRPKDEVDEIFDKKSKKSKKDKKKREEEVLAEKKALPDLEDVFKSIKASVE
ncbi:Nucleolar protein 9 [Microbotryomycetes sp. JL221]|nr:Nucleolar protein 9 [Microbotryomycetes sp. JL221]